MSQAHFLTLDANKKPSIRKGVNYQSYIPPVLPGGSAPRPKSASLKKVHVATDVKLGVIMERLERTLPEMGPFNMIAPEYAVEYFETFSSMTKDEGAVRVPDSNYWDHLQGSLDKIVKLEEGDDGSTSSGGGFSLDNLRSLLSQLEAWNERAIRATLGTGQVLSNEIDELLEEARIIGKRVQLPKEIVAKLRVLQRAGESFSLKVQSKLSLKGKEKVPLSVLTDLMKEAEALPIETEEVRFFRNQRGRIQTICHSAQKATKDKSLEKSKEVTIEAAEVRAILPDLNFLKDKVSIGEWVQKALSKVDKKASVPLQVIEQLFEDPSAALIKPEECEIMQSLQTTMKEAQAWQTKAQKVLAGMMVSGTRRMPSIDDLQSLQEEHLALSKVCVPQMSAAIEGLVRRAKAWVKKQERTLSGTWSLVDAKSLLDEGKQISQQVDLNPEIGLLDAEVREAENWCFKARKLVNSLALSEIDQLAPLVNSSFKEEGGGSSPPSSKRARQQSPPVESLYTPPSFDPARLQISSSKELQGLRNYENSMSDLAENLRILKSSSLLAHLSSSGLPTQTDLEALKSGLGLVRDPNLEMDIVQLFEGAQKWSDRAASVLGSPFPRQAGVLRALTTLIHDLRISPMRYRYWSEIVEAASAEVWAHAMRYVQLPLPEGAVEYLVRTCPVAIEEPMDVDGDAISREAEEREAENFREKQNEWVKQVLGLETRAEFVPASEMQFVFVCQKIARQYAHACTDLLTSRRVPMHTRAEAEHFLDVSLNESPLLSLPSLIVRVESALAKNLSLEASSVALREKLRSDHAEWKNGSSERTHKNGLFHELLMLLEAVEFAELRVEHFDTQFTPIVGKLLQNQASIRAVFKWDPDETVAEPGYRPSLAEVETAWHAIRDEADSVFGLSEWFLEEVAYLASAHNVLGECKVWRENLEVIVGALRAGENTSVSVLKKHVSRWPLLAAQVPFEEVLSAEELAGIDAWFSAVSGIIGRTGQNRTSLAEAEVLLASAPAPLCVHSMEQAALRSHVDTARALLQAAQDTIALSVREREELTVPTEPVVDVPDTLGAELVRILRDCKKSPVHTGVEQELDAEITARTYAKTLHRLLGRPGVVPVELVGTYLDEWKKVPDLGLEPALWTEATKRYHCTLEWQSRLASVYADQLANAVLPDQGKKTKGPPSAPSDPIEAALAAPPTASGEKALEIVLRQLDRDLDGDLGPLNSETAQIAGDYLYPLPLYQLPPPPPVAAPTRKGVGKSAAISPSAENPLLRKNLSPLQQLLFQVPWTRPGQGYLSPLVEILAERSPEFVRGEKSALKARIAQRAPSLARALFILLEHKRGGLFQTSDYVKIRALAAQSIRTVRHCVTRFPFLTPKHTNGGDIPAEFWEKYIQPSGHGEEDKTKSADPELDLFNYLLQLEALAIQVPTKYRLLLQLLDLYDWRVRAQCVCHHMDKHARPRPWAGDERALAFWAHGGGSPDIFSGSLAAPPLDPLCIHVVPCPPPADFILCAMHISFFYVVESCRHFIRVMTDMCELCYGVSVTDDSAFWIACDVCDKWFHGACAGLAQEVPAYTCPRCVLAGLPADSEKARHAQMILNTLPPPRVTPVPEHVRRKEAETLLQEARAQPVITAVNPSELQVIQKDTNQPSM